MVIAASLEPSVARQRRTQAERTALSDKRMFDAALALISEHGVGNTTLREIGERAGYSRGLANSRFGSKEQFLDELISCIHETWQQEATQVVGRRRGLEALQAGVDLMIGFLSRDTHYVRSMYLLYYETIGGNQPVRQRLSRRHNAYRRTIARWIREGIEDGVIREDVNGQAVAIEFLAFYFGVIYLWLSCPENIDFESIFSEYKSGLMQRIAKQQ